MGLRESLTRTLSPELHGCAPSEVQPCNFKPNSATPNATGTQLRAVLHRQTSATATATAVQQASCTGSNTGATDAVALLHFTRDATVQPMREPLDAVAWTAADIERFLDRRTRLMRWGYVEADAEALAERLTLRDRAGDDRAACVECEHLERGGRCSKARTGQLPGTSRLHEPVQNILQRCEGFAALKR